MQQSGQQLLPLYVGSRVVEDTPDSIVALHIRVLFSSNINRPKMSLQEVRVLHILALAAPMPVSDVANAWSKRLTGLAIKSANHVMLGGKDISFYRRPGALDSLISPLAPSTVRHVVVVSLCTIESRETARPRGHRHILRVSRDGVLTMAIAASVRLRKRISQTPITPDVGHILHRLTMYRTGYLAAGAAVMLPIMPRPQRQDQLHGKGPRL